MNVLVPHLETVLKTEITSFDRLSGGDINSAFRLRTTSQDYFLKTNDSVSALAMFKAESAGLAELRKADCIKIPRVTASGSVSGVAYLLMEFIPSKSGTSSQMSEFGNQLAELHACTRPSFGLTHDNFIGSLPQSNAQMESWPDFYVERRLEPQFQMAFERGLMSVSEIPSSSEMLNAISSICQDSKPSLLHGDLWSGNFLISEKGIPYLIDPAVYYGDCMVDIAMSKLFGGFSQAFYDAYFEKSVPIKNKSQKIDLYQLYYLLVHLNLFGTSYHPSVITIIKRLF